MHVSESRLCHTQTQSFPVLVRVRTHDNVVTDDGGHHVALGVVPSHVNHRAILDVRLRADLHLLHITCACVRVRVCHRVRDCVSFGGGAWQKERATGRRDVPRTTAPYHTAEPAPMVTSPATVAFGATNTPAPTNGVLPFSGTNRLERSTATYNNITHHNKPHRTQPLRGEIFVPERRTPTSSRSKGAYAFRRHRPLPPARANPDPGPRHGKSDRTSVRCRESSPPCLRCVCRTCTARAYRMPGGETTAQKREATAAGGEGSGHDPQEAGAIARKAAQSPPRCAVRGSAAHATNSTQICGFILRAVGARLWRPVVSWGAWCCV